MERKRLGNRFEPLMALMGEMKHTGSCLCGNVSFEVSGEIKAISHCHCRDCQKSHAAAFATFGSTEAENFSIKGEAFLNQYTEPEGSTRLFCRVCGSVVRWIGSGEKHAGWISFPISLLDTKYESQKQKHIWVSDKVPWYSISDGYPQRGN